MWMDTYSLQSISFYKNPRTKRIGTCTVLFPLGREVCVNLLPLQQVLRWSQGRAKDRQCNFRAADRKLADSKVLCRSHAVQIRGKPRARLNKLWSASRPCLGLRKRWSPRAHLKVEINGIISQLVSRMTPIMSLLISNKFVILALGHTSPKPQGQDFVLFSSD